MESGGTDGWNLGLKWNQSEKLEYVERELISLKNCGTADHKQSRPLMGRYNRKHSGLSLIKYIEDEDKLAKIFKFEASVSFGFANSRYQGFFMLYKYIKMPNGIVCVKCE